MRVKADANLSFYIVFAVTYVSPSTISSRQRAAYWFPAKSVKAGHNNILYTGNGTPSEFKEPSGATNYFFYWGLPTTTWAKTRESAVLFEVNTWQTSKYE
jgi:hypothetical protein